MDDSTSESLRILCDNASKALDSFFSHSRHIDTKASIMMAFFGILFVPSLDIFRLFSTDKLIFYLRWIPLLFIIVGFILCLIALSLKKYYSTPNFDGIENMYKEGKSPNEIRAQLFSYYKNSIYENKKMAELKIEFTKYSIWIAALAFFLITILFLYKGVVNG